MAASVAWSGAPAVLRRPVLAICAVVFLADLIAGIVLPSFSLFAQSLGASLVLIGTLTTLGGLTQFASSVPAGLLSDRFGRRAVLLVGMLSWAFAMLSLGLARGTALLVVGRLLLGLAMVATFWIAAAYLGDVVTGRERGVAFGLLTTAMGLGFAIGPLLGGWIAGLTDLATSYLVAAGIGVAGAVLVLVLLPRRPPAAGGIASGPRSTLRQGLRAGWNRNLVAAATGGILTTVGFGGAVLTFFPLYGSRLGLAEGAIGTMFAVRAVVSTVARLPAGALAGIVGSRTLMVAALALEAIAILGLGVSQRPLALGAMLALEGIAFGGFLTAAHAFIADHTVPETRGAALGFYSTAGGVGGMVAPFGLGLIAAAYGLAAVFFVTAGLVGLGLMVVVWLGGRSPVRAIGTPASVAASGESGEV